MDRRSFLLWAAAGGATALGTAAGFWRWEEITPNVLYPGRAVGHFLRDRRALPPSSRTLKTDVVILGSGIAGLTAAWKLNKEQHHDFLLIEGPELYGNAAASHFGKLACPTGAHYLPVPSTELAHVREILYDLGILLRNPQGERPYYDERYLLHAPEERLLFQGKWQEGLIPAEGAVGGDADEFQRFFKEIARIRNLRGKDGKRLFVLPMTLSSTDAEWQALDNITFKTWCEQHDFRSSALHWYLDYCCRDDYGARHDQVSAWAGLHYFCSRTGQADNASNGAWLTWPGGLQPLAEGMSKAAGQRRQAGTAINLKQTPTGVEALCVEWVDGKPRTFTVQARKAICAMPLYVASHVVPSIKEYGFDPAAHMPHHAPWLIANFLMKAFPAELPHAPLCWDNVVYQGRGLGYVVSTHQDIRVTPPTQSIFSAYVALSERTPEDARKWLDRAAPDELLELASADLKAAYGWKLAACVERVDITVRGHAMAIPRPGFRTNPGLKALRELDGSILFAHADLSGFSVFEEASWWGYRAATLAAT
ncbi:MAG: NAD(P)-binding protein [Proteobacteria bacterium]|nr:NAD(P)-binding protein [Pseudomonadota bacterium]